MALSDIVKELAGDISGADIVKLGGKALTAGILAKQKAKAANQLADKQSEFAQQNLNKFGGLSKSIEKDLMSGKYDSDALAKATSDQDPKPTEQIRSRTLPSLKGIWLAH